MPGFGKLRYIQNSVGFRRCSPLVTMVYQASVIRSIPPHLDAILNQHYDFLFGIISDFYTASILLLI